MVMMMTTTMMLCAAGLHSLVTLRIMVRHEEWSRGRHEDMKMTAAERLPATVRPLSPKVLGMMGRRKRPIAIVNFSLITEGFF